MQKDKQDEAQRHAQARYLIEMGFQYWLVREKDADEVNADRRIMAKE